MFHDLHFHRNNFANLVHEHATHVIYYGHGSLSNTHFHIVMYHTLSFARAHSYRQRNAYFEGISSERVSCGFGALGQGCYPSTLFQSIVWHVAYFLPTVENPQN